jgi:hypothetical protein
MPAPIHQSVGRLGRPSAKSAESILDMYELVVVACLMAQPAHCETFYLELRAGGGIMQCMMQSQVQLARWLETRPEWVIRRWTCGLPRA